MAGSLIVIPWAETEWSASGRVGSRTPLPLSQTGRAQMYAWADEIAMSGADLVCSSDEQTSTEMAAILAKRVGATRKTLSPLSEVDVGLWNGLTSDELKRRYPKSYKKWCADPSGVCPPEGEDIEHAFERLRTPLERLMLKHADRSVAVVFGPLALAVARCWIETADLSEVRSMTCPEPLRYELLNHGDSKTTSIAFSKPAGMTQALGVANTTPQGRS